MSVTIIHTRPPPPPPTNVRPAPPLPRSRSNRCNSSSHYPQRRHSMTSLQTSASAGPSRSPTPVYASAVQPISVPLRSASHDNVARRRSRSRDIFPSWRALRSKTSQRQELVDEPMLVESLSSAVVPVYPPSLPPCSLEATFQCSDTNVDIPPAFYPGQAIPTVLTFRLDRFSSLSHSLNPTLTMSLVGTLHLPNSAPQTIICVSVSLADGLELWARDAQQVYASRPPSPVYPSIDPTTCLPGGTYSLPLTVQVPCTPRLPPSFATPGSSFAVTYALSVTLTCDDPARPGGRVYLAETARGFEMMPETLPTRTPRYSPTSFWVKSERPASTPARSRSLTRRPNSKWSVEPFLPTTTFSPTSTIPLRIKLSPPEEPDLVGTRYQVVVRLAVIRREHLSTSPAHVQDPSGQSGLVKEVEVISRYAWFETVTETIEFEAALPLMIGNRWTHGFSTMLNVGSANSAQGPIDTIAVSSTYHLATTLAFLPQAPGLREVKLQDVFPFEMPAMGVFSEPTTMPPFDLSVLKRRFPGTIRTLPLPIVVGSVSEPRSAMQLLRWSDLHLERTPNGEEIGRIITGEQLSCEDGWIQAPPSYGDAIETVPYEF
ncbi:hypothetical protein BD324DRAFT_651834 [Kockovaella imperatae]|uniref:Uncharacterized protein n=1 Tax=Kockovaella imperatae TaxID=4999 RepID=A0A1Y1UD35_9TREE|nr:hypothetical protein BD324DRAFT_651834 [Kockovaella imperatae]ORX35922.1 hypothetical protein BD324DRAFT_651834 [Kockovaella imperatae]